MNYFCKKCVYPIHAVNLDIDDDGICSACHTMDEVLSLDDTNWNSRTEKLVKLIESYKKYTEGDYDCIIPVGGGKDSYYQVHVIKSLGYKPLLVTYYGNNFLPEGEHKSTEYGKKFRL